jgi:hypothetical protein
LAQPRSVDVFVSGCPGANGTTTFADRRRGIVVIVSVDFESADMRSIEGVKSEGHVGAKCSRDSTNEMYFPKPVIASRVQICIYKSDAAESSRQYPVEFAKKGRVCRFVG